jgi:hypothetical protein
VLKHSVTGRALRSNPDGSLTGHGGSGVFGRWEVNTVRPGVQPVMMFKNVGTGKYLRIVEGGRSDAHGAGGGWCEMVIHMNPATRMFSLEAVASHCVLAIDARNHLALGLPASSRLRPETSFSAILLNDWKTQQRAIRPSKHGVAVHVSPHSVHVAHAHAHAPAPQVVYVTPVAAQVPPGQYAPPGAYPAAAPAYSPYPAQPVGAYPPPGSYAAFAGQPQYQPHYQPHYQPAPTTCPKCNGKAGWGAFGACLRTDVHYRSPCPCCNGTGTFVGSPIACPKCSAKGGLGKFGPCELNDVHFTSVCVVCSGRCFITTQLRACHVCHGKGGLGAFGPCETSDVHFRQVCNGCNGRCFV